MNAPAQGDERERARSGGEPTRPHGELALELRGLERGFRAGLLGARRAVLRGVDLELAPGRSLALVGPNGSGKSTLLAIAAGVDPAWVGAARVFGRDPRTPAARRRIGFLPDRAPFPGELGGRAVLELCGALSGLDRRTRKARAAEYLERVGLTAEARKPYGRYSRGMQRRLALAQAFQHAPDLLLLDEPTAGLDAPGFLVLEELVLAARARGAALLFASHLLADVTDHGDEIAVLHEGRIARRGPTADVLAEGGGLLALYRDLGATA